MDAQQRDRTKLNRALPKWQIFLLAISGIIGVTIFSTHGEIINNAGPAGILVAELFVAVTAICVMECLGEMIVLWPVSNAMIEYVKAFVDEDLGIVVGLAYWYTWASVFATLLIAAADFSEYFITEQYWRTIIFFVVVPLILLWINLLGVRWYGWVEGVGGALKLVLVLAGAFFMMADAGRVGSQNVNKGFEHQQRVAPNDSTAICMSIPVLTYGFLGVEIVSVTAFEAKDRTALRLPAKYIAYVITLLYLLCSLLEAVDVYFNDPNLPRLNDRSAATGLTRRSTGPGPGFYAAIVIAARQYGSPAAGWFFNGCIIYFCISASNTALYVASRTLYGLTRELNRLEQPDRLRKVLSYLGLTTPYRHVPFWALIISFFSFCWLPILQVRGGLKSQDLLTIMSTTGSIGGVLVWASQCFAYIRYYHWFHYHAKRGWLPAGYDRWNPQPDRFPWHKQRMLMASAQPAPAYVGLLACLLIVFVFSTATWWDGVITFKKVATAFAGPFILFCVFVSFKLWRRRLWAQLGSANNDTFRLTSNFERNSGIEMRIPDEDRGIDMEMPLHGNN